MIVPRTALFDSRTVGKDGMAGIEWVAIDPAGPPRVGERLFMDCDHIDVVLYGDVTEVDEAASTARVRVEIAR